MEQVAALSSRHLRNLLVLRRFAGSGPPKSFGLDSLDFASSRGCSVCSVSPQGLGSACLRSPQSSDALLAAPIRLAPFLHLHLYLVWYLFQELAS
jgi:hypothetical protein